MCVCVFCLENRGKFVKEFGIFVALKFKFKSLRLRVILSVNTRVHFVRRGQTRENGATMGAFAGV